MPVNKTTIAHQLKTVKNTKSKPSSVIHTNSNIVATSPRPRSHLHGSGPQWKKSSYERREDVIDAGDLSHSELKQCTRILRNVLANEENKSTSTDDRIYEDRIVNVPKIVGFKSGDISDNSDRGISGDKFPLTEETVDEVTEAESLSSNPEPKSLLANIQNQFHRNNPLKVSLKQSKLCTCYTDLNNNNNNNPMHESKKATTSGDCARGSMDKSAVCARCHNIIPQQYNSDNVATYPTEKNCEVACGYERYHDKYSAKDYKTQASYDNIGDEKIDNIVGLLQAKVNEIGVIARTTRDADLDRLVSDIDRAFQQMLRENSLVFNHLKTITKTLKWDNSGMKQKMKGQLESYRDLKSELKLIRQEHKQKIDELKLEVQLKEDEVRQLTEKERNSTAHWSDKYHSLEREYEKLRSEFQGQMLQSCQKDAEIIQLRHTSTQNESKLKEQLHSLTLSKQHIEAEFSKVQEINRKYDQECHHNQSIIKAAREHVISLLDRHKHERDGSSCTGGYRFESACETPPNGSGDWIHQATSLQQVLSMVSDARDGQKLSANNTGSSANYCSSSAKAYDQSRSVMISPINFATANYNNNYVSSSTCNANISESSKIYPDTDAIVLQLPSSYPDDRSISRSPSEISSTISRNSFSLSQASAKAAGLRSVDDCHTITKSGTRLNHGMSIQVDDSWNFAMPKAKMSSASSVQSTVSSLRSTDDREFRSGLQRLDSQISRLQTTLQSKLQCK